MGVLNQGCMHALIVAPDFIWNMAERLLIKRLPADYLQQLQMERFGKYLLKHFDKVWQRAVQNKKCMIIEKGAFGYTYFNIAYINNVISLVIYALYKGCIPVIKINDKEPDYNKWTWYFEQPYDIMKTDITGFSEIPCDVRDILLKPEMQMIHNRKNWKYKLFQMLFQRLICLNKETQLYVENEIVTIGDPTQMLGVLLRGTDYVKLRPLGHPVQPEPEEVVQKVKERFSTGMYSAVYVATEEKKLYDMVKSAVGEQNIRENRRQYYDELYYGTNQKLIGKVRFDRENDNYWKGLEYLSSLMILSRCPTLIAGNCGGTLFAVLMADYHKPTIFDYGIY